MTMPQWVKDQNQQQADAIAAEMIRKVSNVNDLVTANLPEFFNEYRKQVIVRGETEPGFWFGKCINWYACGRSQVEFVMADGYFDSYETARANGVEWGMRVCRNCARGAYQGSFVIAMRKRTIFKKRRECTDSAEKCARAGSHFIEIGGRRRWMCVNHIAIHSEYTEVFRIRQHGEIENVTWELNSFYNDHQRGGFVKA